MSSRCRNPSCPGAHGEGGTKTDPDHVVIHSHARRTGRDLSRAPDCGRCDGTGEIGEGARLQTCPVCRGSTLGSGAVSP